MTLSTGLLTWNRLFLGTVVTALAARPAAALAAGLSLGLYENLLDPGPNDLLAAYTACTFSGYAPVSPTQSVPVNLPSQAVATVVDGLYVAAVAGPFVPGIAVGCMLSTGGLLVASYRFPDAVNFVQVGDFLELVVALPFMLFAQAS